jgi:hypothetical protein
MGHVTACWLRPCPWPARGGRLRRARHWDGIWAGPCLVRWLGICLHLRRLPRLAAGRLHRSLRRGGFFARSRRRRSLLWRRRFRRYLDRNFARRPGGMRRLGKKYEGEHEACMRNQRGRHGLGKEAVAGSRRRRGRRSDSKKLIVAISGKASFLAAALRFRVRAQKLASHTAAACRRPRPLRGDTVVKAFRGPWRKQPGTFLASARRCWCYSGSNDNCRQA